MTTVVLGQNRFLDCRVIIGYGDRPLLRVMFDPFSIEFATPSGRSSTEIHVLPDGQIVPSEPSVHVVRADNFFGVFWKDQALIVATLIDRLTANVKLDLRPIGINIYDDYRGLHIGTNTIAGNEIRGAATAIALAD